MTGIPLKTYANHIAIHWALEAVPALVAVGLGSYELLVLISISRHIGHNGQPAYPSVDSIAQESLCSRDTVLRSLARLVAHGFIRKVDKHPTGTNRYEIALTYPMVVNSLEVADREPISGLRQLAPVAAGNRPVAASNSLRCSEQHEVDPDTDPEVGHGKRSVTSSGLRAGEFQPTTGELALERRNNLAGVVTSAQPVAVVPDEARALADRYFELLNRPQQHAHSVQATWTDLFSELLQDHPYNDLLGAMDWALRSSNFWPKYLHRWKGSPVEYFGHKLPTIVSQWRGERNTAANGAGKPSAGKRTPVNDTANRINSLLNFG